MIKKITVDIDGEDKEMSYEAAQKLYFDLKGMFEQPQPVVVPFVQPTEWQWWKYQPMCTGNPMPEPIAITCGEFACKSNSVSFN